MQHGAAAYLVSSAKLTCCKKMWIDSNASVQRALPELALESSVGWVTELCARSIHNWC
jgi:hypothetical protein